MITYCIPSKNNLRYLKGAIRSVKEDGPCEIIVFVDTDQDGTEEWLKQNNIRYILNNTDVPFGISYGYNRCTEAAETDIVCMFHADMYMAKGFTKGIMKYLKRGTVVSATRIEPPLHPKGLEKIVKDFGMYPEDFKESEFNSYASKAIEIYKGKTTNGIFAPWAIYKDDLVAVGLHDESLVSCHEDSDLFQTFLLKGYEFVQTWESLVYHLTCRGGQFQDGIEQTTTNALYHYRKRESEKTFIRKWGHPVKVDEYLRPIIVKRNFFEIKIKNSNKQIDDFFEPYGVKNGEYIIEFDARALNQYSIYVFHNLICNFKCGTFDCFNVIKN